MMTVVAALGCTAGPDGLCLTGVFFGQGDGVAFGAVERRTVCLTVAAGDWVTEVIAPLTWSAGAVAPVAGAEELSVSDGEGDTVPLDESLGVGVGLGL
jgi:hypothetical protein